MAKNNEPIIINVKHKKLRIVFTIIFAVIAVISFSYSVYSCTKVEINPGLQKINLMEINVNDGNTDVPFYDEIEFYYYLENSKDLSIKEQYEAIYNGYNTIMQVAYLLTNEDYGYNTANIHTINNSIGEYVQIDQRLFEILNNAYQKTISEGSKYNMFSKHINDIWESNYVNASINKKITDPLTHPIQDEYIKTVLSIINNYSLYALEFNQDDFSVKLSLSEQCYDEDGTPLVQIDLNTLKHAYVLEMVANFLINGGFNNGYLLSKHGYKLTLGGSYTYNLKDTFNIYRPVSSKYRSDVIIASIEKEGKVAFSSFGDYLTNLWSFSLYSLEKENKMYYRHPYYNSIDGVPHNNMRNSSIISTDDSLYDIAYTNLNLFNSTLDEAKTYALNNSNINNSYLFVIDNMSYDNSNEEMFVYYDKNIDSSQLTIASINDNYLGKIIE